jgi:hypothetical protein
VAAKIYYCTFTKLLQKTEFTQRIEKKKHLLLEKRVPEVAFSSLENT